MKSLEILGAASDEVTGSHNLLTLNSGAKILVDCGMYQGPSADERAKQQELTYDPKELEAIVVTHGHLDHIGGIPRLAAYRDYEQLPIYMTSPTQEIVRIQLDDASRISKETVPYKGVEWAKKNIKPIPYGVEVQIDGAKLSFSDAGHILGSASATIEECRGERAVFSGDLGKSPSRTVRPFDPPDEASIVVMESTYGDRVHVKEDPKDFVKDAIDVVDKKKKGGTILIPSFAIDRTQMLLRILKEMRESGELKKSVPVFLDSPMAISMTDLYQNYRYLLNEELQEEQNPFQFSNLHMTRDYVESKRIKNHQGPKIIIAGSGMMSGGRIGEHATRYLPEEENVILFVGHPAKGTPSRRIAEEEAEEVEIDGKRVKVKAKVRRINGLSAHADQDQLTEWVDHIKGGQTPVRKIVLNHGEARQRRALSDRIMEPGIEVVLPENGDLIDLTTNN